MALDELAQRAEPGRGGGRPLLDAAALVPPVRLRGRDGAGARLLRRGGLRALPRRGRREIVAIAGRTGGRARSPRSLQAQLDAHAARRRHPGALVIGAVFLGGVRGHRACSSRDGRPAPRTPSRPPCGPWRRVPRSRRAGSSTDEIGDLAAATGVIAVEMSRVFEQLRGDGGGRPRAASSRATAASSRRSALARGHAGARLAA